MYDGCTGGNPAWPTGYGEGDYLSEHDGREGEDSAS